MPPKRKSQPTQRSYQSRRPRRSGGLKYTSEVRGTFNEGGLGTLELDLVKLYGKGPEADVTSLRASKFRSCRLEVLPDISATVGCAIYMNGKLTDDVEYMPHAVREVSRTKPATFHLSASGPEAPPSMRQLMLFKDFGLTSIGLKVFAPSGEVPSVSFIAYTTWSLMPQPEVQIVTPVTPTFFALVKEDDDVSYTVVE
jgi:hypothetical protein